MAQSLFNAQPDIIITAIKANIIFIILYLLTIKTTISIVKPMTIFIEIPYRHDTEVEDWCLINFSAHGARRVYCDIDVNQTIQTFIFEDETDAMAFKLRWT